jgi:FkbM family methyltransferase
MNQPSDESAAPNPTYQILLQNPSYGSGGLSVNLRASTTDPGLETYVTLHSKANDIMLFLGIRWNQNAVALSKCVGGTWLDRIIQPVSITGTEVGIVISIMPGAISVEFDGKHLVTWPLPILFTELVSIHGLGDWSLASTSPIDLNSTLLKSVLPELPVENNLLNEPQHDLIFDFGMHNGDDSDYYLKKGFRVVAIDANPTLSALGVSRFGGLIADQRLTICNIGVAPVRGELTFYINNDITEWSSFDRDIASRGHAVVETKVKTAPPEDFFRAFGVPYYCKIDIEGFDRLILETILKLPAKPRYVSFENGDLRDFETMVAAGYTGFQLVEQSKIPEVQLPNPSSEGNTIVHRFPSGSSGPFGGDLGGEWKGIEETRAMLTHHHLELAARAERGYDWWDLHARHGNS